MFRVFVGEGGGGGAGLIDPACDFGMFHLRQRVLHREYSNPQPIITPIKDGQ